MDYSLVNKTVKFKHFCDSMQILSKEGILVLTSFDVLKITNFDKPKMLHVEKKCSYLKFF